MTKNTEYINIPISTGNLFPLCSAVLKTCPRAQPKPMPCSVSVPTLFSSTRHLPQAPSQGKINKAVKPTFHFWIASSPPLLLCLICELILFISLTSSLLSVFLQLPARLCPLPVTSLHGHQLLWHGAHSHLLYMNFPLSP